MIRTKHGYIGLATACCASAIMMAAAVAAAQAAPSDVGLVTRLSGEVTYSGVAQKKPARARAFMKVQQGDSFELAVGAELRLVYFASGRQESWKGPVAFKVGEKEGQAEGKAAGPEVEALPAKASPGLRRVPALLKWIGSSRAGGIQVRGERKESPRLIPLTSEEKAEIGAARELSRKMRGQAAPDDVTPELYLIGILSDYEQYEEMAQVLKSARSRQPDNQELKTLEAWLREKIAQAQP